MGEAPSPTNSGAGTRRFLTFRMDRQLYALPAEDIAEVIRTPTVARLPQAPKSLLGLANLRGAVLPVASLRALLGGDARAMDANSRAIVLDGGAPVALAVDRVEALLTISDDRIETRQAELAADPGERLAGAFQTQADGDVAKVLDIRSLIADAFVQRPRAARRTNGRAALAQADSEEASEAIGKLVSFDVAGQEYALPLDTVREIVPVPAGVASAPRSEALVLGVAGYRDSLLPLLSLRGLLGFPPAPLGGEREKVVVTQVGDVLVGLVADKMRSIVPADPQLIDPAPPVLAARTGGESRIAAIYRGDGGRRLISILDPAQLFREDVMLKLGKAAETHAQTEDLMHGDTLRFLVFRLGDDEFGLPIEAVDEVARMPEQVTRVPKTPKFLEGVVNLRGEVLPVVDQRRRFDMPELTDKQKRRLIVVRTDQSRAGLIVDSVSEVLQSDAAAIEPAPDLTGEATRLVNGVVNLEDAGRMILLLDPSELLSRSERGLLDRFQSQRGQDDL